MKKKIVIFSAGRSDFGILRPIILSCLKKKNISLKVIFGFAHQEKIFGTTFNESKNLNLKKFKIKLQNKSHESNIHNTISSFSETANKVSLILKKNNCDNFLVAGDRYETLAAVIAAKNYNIKISHLCGGSTTLGSLDDYYRNCISNLANYHFVETTHHKLNLNKKNIFKNVYVVGAPALENLSQFNNLRKFTKNNVSLGSKKLIVTFHPDTTLSISKNILNLKILLKFLSKLKKFYIIFTYPNADTGFNNYIRLIKLFNKKYKNVKLIKNLGIKKYYENLQMVDVMIGNSSSGIIESASFKIPVINIGNRQKKRFSPKNVINCNFELNDLKTKLNIALSQKFLKNLKNLKNPYLKANTSKKIINVIMKN